jgi:hypothetical protein
LRRLHKPRLPEYTPETVFKSDAARDSAISHGHIRRAVNELILGRVAVLAEGLEDLHEKKALM